MSDLLGIMAKLGKRANQLPGDLTGRRKP